jgi:hypothetical protein
MTMKVVIPRARRARSETVRNTSFVRNLPPHARASAWFCRENRRQYGAAASSGSLVL